MESGSGEWPIMGMRHLPGCLWGIVGGDSLFSPPGSVLLCWDRVASHGTQSILVPAVGKEVTALRVFPKFKPVVPLPGPGGVASVMVDLGEAGVERSWRLCRGSGVLSAVLEAGQGLLSPSLALPMVTVPGLSSWSWPEDEFSTWVQSHRVMKPPAVLPQEDLAFCCSLGCPSSS